MPEIADGLVEIANVAREPGYRSKIAVVSHADGVDPVGACVGPRGSRVRMVVSELRGEKIDIIPYNDEPARFVAKALSPARVREVLVDDENRQATVVVPDDQLSLAIGREGQNARLAARLTGWRIDIKSETEFSQEEAEHGYEDEDAVAGPLRARSSPPAGAARTPRCPARATAACPPTRRWRTPTPTTSAAPPAAEPERPPPRPARSPRSPPRTRRRAEPAASTRWARERARRRAGEARASPARPSPRRSRPTARGPRSPARASSRPTARERARNPRTRAPLRRLRAPGPQGRADPLRRGGRRAARRPRRRLPGRGAYLHRDAACWEAAVARRGFAQALRERRSRRETNH